MTENPKNDQNDQKCQKMALLQKSRIFIFLKQKKDKKSRYSM